VAAGAIGEAVVKKFLVWFAIGVLIFYMVTQPTAAAQAWRTTWGTAGDVANGISAFLTNLTA
jgi:hypothetical protein